MSDAATEFLAGGWADELRDQAGRWETTAEWHDPLFHEGTIHVTTKTLHAISVVMDDRAALQASLTTALAERDEARRQLGEVGAAVKRVAALHDQVWEDDEVCAWCGIGPSDDEHGSECPYPHIYDAQCVLAGTPTPPPEERRLAPCAACVSEYGRAMPDCNVCGGSGICPSERGTPPEADRG